MHFLSAPDVIAESQAAWYEAGHPGQGEVRLRLSIYVAESMDQARSEPQASALPYYKRVRQAYLRSVHTFESTARAARAMQMATLTYEDVLQTRVVFGHRSMSRHGSARYGMKLACRVLSWSRISGDASRRR